MKNIIRIFLITTLFLSATAAFADDKHRGHSRRGGGVEWGVGISPGGDVVLGFGSRGSGAGNVWHGGRNLIYAPPPVLYYAPPPPPVYLRRPFCTYGNTYYFPDGAIIGEGTYYIPAGSTVGPGGCYY